VILKWFQSSLLLPASLLLSHSTGLEFCYDVLCFEIFPFSFLITFLYPGIYYYYYFIIICNSFVCEYFVTKICFHGEELLAPHPTPNLEHPPLSAVRDCLFNILAATLHKESRSSFRNLGTCHAVGTRTRDVDGRIILR
jgi:hypothetical protein